MSTVQPQDVLLRVGGRALDQGVLAIAGAGRSVVELKETFTRASVGYFLDRDGIIRKAAVDKIRDYWPPGLVDSQGRRLHGPLIESARTNGWATVTENYADAAWVKAGCTISSNAHVAPDGVLASADKIVESALNELHTVHRTIAGMTDNTRTSVWFLVKAAERTWVRILTIDKANVARSTFFNLATGALGTKDAAHDAWIRPLGSSLGYYFIAVSFDAASGATTPLASLRLATGDNIGAYAGDGVSGLYVWESGVEVDKPYPSHPGSILPNGLARAGETASVLANFGPVDTTILYRFYRPMWGDATVDIGGFPEILNLGTASDPNPRLEVFFQQATRQFSARSGTSASQATRNLPAGSALSMISQHKDLTTAPAVAVDVNDGAGLTAFDTGAPAFSAYNNQTFRVGGSGGTASFSGVLFDLMALRGLASHAEALAASDA